VSPIATGSKSPNAIAPDSRLKRGASTNIATATDAGCTANIKYKRGSAALQGSLRIKKKYKATLPKAVGGERSSKATGAATNAEVFRAFVIADQRLAEVHVHCDWKRKPLRP